jgi:predicted DNA-binding ArsR family transcriptional regulator
MKLKTVKIYSQNELLRGKDFDVYYNDVNDIEIIAVEEVANVVNLLPTLDAQSIKDVIKSLKYKVENDNALKVAIQFTPEQNAANAVALAEENKAMGYSND